MTTVVHHIEVCVKDGKKTLGALQKFGFYLFGERSLLNCHQWAVKVGNAVFVVTERKTDAHFNGVNGNHSEDNSFLVFCCKESTPHEVDSVFNVSFCVKNVQGVTDRVLKNGGRILQEPTQVKDKFGEITYSIVKSCCGNVVHTLINKDNYAGFFLPGFQTVDTARNKELDEWDKQLTHVDHVTLACHTGNSQSVITWYENCFGMKRFAISRDDNEDEGLILKDGVGLRLRAMEYWRCAETGLFYPSANDERHPNGVMLVVVESIPGQVNCNIENFLTEHEGPGVEHIALSTPFMCETVAKLWERGVSFRKPPAAYYNDTIKKQQILDIGQDLELLQKLGILLDSEVDPEDGENENPKYLMQIFSHPIFNRKTCFIEVIERCGGARGLGAGNIVALVRSIREEKMRLENKI